MTISSQRKDVLMMGNFYIKKKYMSGLKVRRLFLRLTMLLFLTLSVFLWAGCSGSGDSSSQSSNSGTSDNGSNRDVSKTGSYKQNGGTVTQTGNDYSAMQTDESAVYVYSGGTYTLNGTSSNYAELTKTGDTSASENSNFYGNNAIVLAEDASEINFNYVSLYSNSEGSNGAFAYEKGSVINLNNCTIETHGDSSRGVDATYGGKINICNSTIITSGAHCAALASDSYDTSSGAPNINADNVTGVTSGQGSPGIYCTGTFNVKNSTLKAIGSEAAVIEGTNSITLKDTDLSSTLSATSTNHWGVMIYQSMSGDALGNTGTFTMTGGKLSKTGGGALLLNTNDAGIFNLKDVELYADSGIILQSCKCNWTATAIKGGVTSFTADNQTMAGDFIVDDYGQITAVFKNGSTLTGAIDPDNADGPVYLTLDSTSFWTADDNSYVDTLNGVVFSGGIPTNVDATSGVTIHYGSGTNNSGVAFSGTYTLSSGGTLKKN
jgi:hypothetical protein